MPIVAMKVISAEQHPNADRLRVYMFECPSFGQRQIVANLTNVYEVGDVVAVATPGTMIPAKYVGSDSEDMIEIKDAKIRGVQSHGMALGKIEAEVDQVLGEFAVNDPK